MVQAVTRSLLKLTVLGAAALFSVVLFAAGPAAAQPTTTPAYGPATSPTVVFTPTTVPPAPTTSPAIAFTGADIALMVTVGAAAVGAGGALVLISRRRRSEAAQGA
jgi:hypothetical protein